MVEPGPAKKVSIHIGEDQQYHNNSLYGVILEYLFNAGISGASVTRGLAGFGPDHHLHTSRLLRLSENLPVKIEFIESAEKVEQVLPRISEMVSAGLIEVHDTTVLKIASPRQP